jgi:thioredoxin 1
MMVLGINYEAISSLCGVKYMKSLNEKALQGLKLFNRKPVAVYIHSPLCGTCQLARNMLEIVEQSLPDIDLYEMDVNLLHDTVREWQVESVPCIAILFRGQVVKKVYAMHSVSNLYELLRPLEDQKIP